MSPLKIKKGATSHSAYNLRSGHSDVIERHTLAILVENEPGVLARVIGLFAGRGYNIESLTVAETDHEGKRSRITIVTTGTPQVIEQIKAQLGRIVPVYYSASREEWRWLSSLLKAYNRRQFAFWFCDSGTPDVLLRMQAAFPSLSHLDGCQPFPLFGEASLNLMLLLCRLALLLVVVVLLLLFCGILWC